MRQFVALRPRCRSTQLQKLSIQTRQLHLRARRPLHRTRPCQASGQLRLQQQQRRTLVPPPKSNDKPLMTRRSDRALPALPSTIRVWRSLPVFIAIIVGCALGFFNYQKLSSSVVASTLYAIRTHPIGRDILGDRIYYASKIPWIWGSIDQLHGRIDISFWVKGTKAKALMRFRSQRTKRMGFFETSEWSLETEDGTVTQLLDRDGPDPFSKELDAAANAETAVQSTTSSAVT